MLWDHVVDDILADDDPPGVNAIGVRNVKSFGRFTIMSLSESRAKRSRQLRAVRIYSAVI